jgi:hypothetical protein
MRGGQLLDHNLRVILYNGGDKGQDFAGPLRFLRAGVALVRGDFILLHSFDDAIDLAY